MEAMLSPSIYRAFSGGTADKVKLIQTHISWVFIAGDRVFKIKKPVDFGFLDFSTLERRKEFCEAELRLNRRLCPDIYLETVPLVREGDGWILNGSGPASEWVLVMKRMPEDGLMNLLLERDEVNRSDIGQIVAKLVPFYQQADSSVKVREMGSIATITHNTEENFEQTRGFRGEIIPADAFEAICGYTRKFLADKRDLFEKRISEGWIREGHGDLYSANICFDKEADDVYIFDCIEFNERFRCGDVASDVAFLAMDLDHFGLPQLSDYFIRVFASQSNDPELVELNNFYKCYRAYVRGKIGCFTWADTGVEPQARDASRRQAEDYFKLALRYAGAGATPSLYVFFGLSGTGKSTVAQAWAEQRGIPVFNSDIVRKEIVAGIPAGESRIEPFGRGIYSSEMTRRTYRALSRLAGSRLVRGESAAVDATFTTREEREGILEMAEACGARTYFILCGCGEDEVKRRLDMRQARGDAVSDGRWEIYLKQKEKFCPVGHLADKGLVEIDTALPVGKIVEDLGRRLEA